MFGLHHWNVWQPGLKLSDLPDPGVAEPGEAFLPGTSPGWGLRSQMDTGI